MLSAAKHLAFNIQDSGRKLGTVGLLKTPLFSDTMLQWQRGFIVIGGRSK
jgi:hypothetical protein